MWLDRCPQFSQAELRLDLATDDAAAAERHLASHKVERCDAIETLPEGFDGFWIANPAGIVHIVYGSQDRDVA